MLRASRIHRFARNDLPVSCLPWRAMQATDANKTVPFTKGRRDRRRCDLYFLQKNGYLRMLEI